MSLPRPIQPVDGLTSTVVPAEQSFGFGKRLGFGNRPALLLIDFQQAYITPGSFLYAGVEASAEVAIRILAAARNSAIQIAHTRVYFEPGISDRGPFFRKVEGLKYFVGEQPEGEFVNGLTPIPGELVIEKQFASAFFSTPLASQLTSAGCDSVIICGWSTSGCVRASTVDAVQHGFVPIVIREAVGDRAEETHQSSLFDLDSKYADVVSENDVVTYLASLDNQSRRPL